MRKAFLIIISILLTHLAFAQNKAEPALDVDRLWKLYKDTSEVIIHLDNQEVTAHIVISYNAAKKPYSVIAYGETDAVTDLTQALEKLKNELGAEKLKAGYRQAPGTYTVNFHPAGNNENVVDVSLFQKGTQSAKYGVKKVTYSDPGTNGQGAVQRYVGNFFYFEVCDEGRRNVSVDKSVKEERFIF
ncbi:hypothetical protein [Mucilaginibacter lacusdianchii]|uniref:hypothetical protein n=1 Tax=Mucilaginibacter lacusdianchii TaxID=2684211 RepID=UPI00131CAB5D|nr:hypothetical protein [Mucilaginibacter sp. JXJ CY 39]